MNSHSSAIPSVGAVILAGGRATRLDNQDKGLVQLLGRAMIEHVLERLQPQVGQILISANRNIETYANYGFEVLADSYSGFLGPLAGIATAMEQCAETHLLVVPCDAPLLPIDLAERLLAQIDGSQIAVAHDGKRMQPTFAIFNVNLLADLQQAITTGDRGLNHWIVKHSVAEVDFSETPGAFDNLNSATEIMQFESKHSGTA